jgi:hypothetical protein
MQLPPRIDALVSLDHGLKSLVLRALSIIEPWTLDNSTVFFHEYTDHSLKHLNEVLLTAEGLISDESWAHLTAEDGAIIILSVLLHDCALHISEDGFYNLINGNYQPKPSRFTDKEEDWPILWDKFLSEARRFDQRKLYSLFGNSDPLPDFPPNKLDLTLKHRLLAGEFLRRHHARLAHEIATSGIPGPNEALELCSESHKDLMDLAGYVARSHNHSLRSSIDRLEPTHRRVYRNCHVPFTMMVLRISDYIQIHSSRAPGQLLRLKSLSSPVSRGEWRKHLSVRDINQAHEDPEAIFVDCEPENAETFVSMRLLLSDIQRELDSSWAVLGEIYGRFSPLNTLGIGIRRIKSNLDDPKEYWRARRPPFLPREFRFKTASAELLDLLAMPLYGDKPEIGIRELVQNAVDACRERDDLSRKGIITTQATEDVTVTLNCFDRSKASIIVEDFGVGMTPDVVHDYLLNIGASFRRSEKWRSNHESNGTSTVHRTGRFGIGLLAAFLLGPELIVTTRSIFDDESSAITFSCRQGSEMIEVKPCRFHAGTRIEIYLSETVIDQLLKNLRDWDWFCTETPKVTRIVNQDTSTILPQGYSVPLCGMDLTDSKWRRVQAKGYDDVIWSYEALTLWGQPDDLLICNGIKVISYTTAVTPAISARLDIINAQPTSLVVYDPDGRFPLNLQRNNITSNSTGFQEEIAYDISLYFSSELARLIKNSTAKPELKNIKKIVEHKIPGLKTAREHRRHTSPFVFSKNGFIPADADLLEMSGVESIVIDATDLQNNRGAFTSNHFLSWVENYFPVDGINNTKISRTEFLRWSIGDFNYKNQPIGFFEGMNIIGRRVLIKKKTTDELVGTRNISRNYWRKLSIEHEHNNWQLWRIGETPELKLDISLLCNELDENDAFGFSIIYFGSPRTPTDEEPKSPFYNAWIDTTGSLTINH